MHDRRVRQRAVGARRVVVGDHDVHARPRARAATSSTAVIAQSTVTSRSRPARGEPLDRRGARGRSRRRSGSAGTSHVGYDAIIVDAYRQPYIPFYLATREFFELVRDRLAPGGSVIVNVGHPEGNDELEGSSAATMAAAFPTVLRDPIEEDEHAAARRATRRRRPRGCAPRRLDPELRSLAAGRGRGLEPRLPGGEVYTDDRAPVEWLIDSAILDYAADD